MTFTSACEFSYKTFKEEYGVGIGGIQECNQYWVFYKYSTEQEYGSMPIIIYKGDKHPIRMTFEVYLAIVQELQTAIEIPVPQKYKL